MQPDLVLFTGDYGNENVELVKSISNIKIPKAAILGNHDCWNTHQFSQKKADRVQLQLECLGEEHVGYRRLDFRAMKFSVVGGRPFSCGGNRLFRPKLLSARYGVNDMEESAKKIYEAAIGTPEEHFVIFLAHNGPTGLGSKVDDICGKDWVFGGGDHGDPDLAQALSDLQKDTQISIPLVVFGHMHKKLAYGDALRKMLVLSANGTLYLNGAIVPRVKQSGQTSQNSEFTNGTSRAFSLVNILDRRVEKVSEVWVLVDGTRVEVEQETVLFTNP
ncbi:uncharacterized protein LOC109712018 isoform X2 [Ananas comosus]|uniref:Uncharacterized protein LOC109712018 isoform X2 n=1 Tax=Ananas comosus TaxID=4615 RepID=A0A6P5FCJ3_ANACO|nr:uncharacterized protein LOC109712018 isoform X2 [Ananas comosus]